MKTTVGNESDAALGFWARLAGAIGSIDTSSVDILESRLARLESQVAKLIGEAARERKHQAYAR